jgi:uncharacterized membrane-anchored protein YjiN (DUF445 family)
MEEAEFSKILEKKKRNFHRLIVKTNSSSLCKERMEILKQKIYDPCYIANAIDKLAENISKALLEGYFDQEPTKKS